MSDFQSEKQTVRDYMAAFDAATPDNRLNMLQKYTSDDYKWRGVHPFNEHPDAASAHDAFWSPLLHAFSSLQRREDIFFAGANTCDDNATRWTCSMGHFMGLFDHPWLGIPPTRKITLIRYAEFHRVEAGKIAETALFTDILAVMRQAGVYPLPTQTASEIIVPGPRTHDGILHDIQDPADSVKTLDTIHAMINMISSVNVAMNDPKATPPTPQDELRQHWHDDMAWYGPAGIGSTYTIQRYAEQHQQPFRRHLANRTFNGHIARLSEGHYGGFFGWPNLTLTPTGGYMGLPGSNKPADMRVTDIYRRDGDKLAENWVIIDMLHFLKMQGLDVLERLQELKC